MADKTDIKHYSIDADTVQSIQEHIMDYLVGDGINFDNITKEQAETIAAHYSHVVEFQFRGIIDAYYGN